MSEPIRILYVDDNPLDRELVRDALEKEHNGFQVTEASSRAEFETRLAEGDYDLVLSDFNILGFEGLQVLDAVGWMKPNLPVIIVTGTGSEEIAVEALKRGAADYVIKTPRHIRRLPLVIHAALEKQRLQREREQTEEAYRVLVEHSLQGFLVFQAGRIAFANVMAAVILGYSVDELGSLSPEQVTNLIHPDDRPMVLERIQARLAGKPAVPQYEYRIVRKNGEIRWLEQSAAMIEYQGKPAIQTTAFDITERKRAEAALRDSQTQLEGIINSAMDAIITIDEGEKIIIFNPAAEVMFRCPASQAIGGTLNRFISEYYRDRHNASVRAFGHSGLTKRSMKTPTLTFISLRADGETFPSEVSISHINIGGRNLYTAIVRDVTERKRAEEILRASEDRYRDLVEHSQDLICTHDLKGHILSVNPWAMRLLGYPIETLLQMSIRDILAPAVRDRFDEYLATLERDGAASGIMLVQTRTGETRLWEYNNTLRTEGIATPLVRGMAHDVTERIRAEEALRASETSFRYLFAHNPHPMWVYDVATLAFLQVNDTAIARYGYTRDEFLQMRITDIRPPEDVAPLLENLRQPRSDIQFSGEWRHRLKDGTMIDVEIVSHKLEFTGRPAVLIVAHDITARKRAEEETRARIAELEAVNRVSVAMRAAETLDQMLPRLLDETLAVFSAEAGVIWLYDSIQDQLRETIARGWFTQIVDTPTPPREGIGGHVFVTGETYVAHEFSSDPRTRETARSQIPAGWGGACVPIRALQQIVGVLFVSVPLPREITTEETHLLITLAEIAGNAIHRTHLHEQTEQHLRRLAALRTIDNAITSSFELRTTLNVLLQYVTSQLRVDAAAVLLFNPHLRTLNFAAGRGFRGSGITRLSLRLGEDYAGQAAVERRLIHVPDLRQASQRFTQAHLTASEGFIAYYGVPLIAKGQIKGVLEIFHRAPLNPDSEWLEFLETLAGQAAIAIDNAELFDGLQSANSELMLSYDATIEGWSRALDLRDEETEGHTQRVTEMTIRLARGMGLSDVELMHLRRGALLHDIGKMGIPDRILLKPDKLTDAEWMVMRQHPVFAYELLSPIAYLRSALDIPYCHHEKWDGTGYPRGLKGDLIPLSARIFAVVDVWDALRSDRPYRKAWSEDQVREHIRLLAGTHFDPQVVEGFEKMMAQGER